MIPVQAPKSTSNKCHNRYDENNRHKYRGSTLIDQLFEQELLILWAVFTILTIFDKTSIFSNLSGSKFKAPQFHWLSLQNLSIWLLSQLAGLRRSTLFIDTLSSHRRACHRLEFFCPGRTSYYILEHQHQEMSTSISSSALIMLAVLGWRPINFLIAADVFP